LLQLLAEFGLRLIVSMLQMWGRSLGVQRMKSKGNLRGHSPIPVRHARERARFRPTFQLFEKNGLVSRGMCAFPAADEIFCETWCDHDPARA
jgi:hypothetical protein